MVNTHLAMVFVFVSSIMSSFNRFTTGRIPPDAKGAAMAELDKPADEKKIKAKITFFAVQ